MTPAVPTILAQVSTSTGEADPSYLCDGSVTFTGNITTAPIYVGHAGAFSVQWSCPPVGNPKGSVSLECSNDNPPGALSPTMPSLGIVNWVDVPNVAAQAVDGATSLLFVEPTCTYRWVRAVYTWTSGTIKPTANLQQKGVGT